MNPELFASDLLLRLFLALGFGLGGLALYFLYNRFVLARARDRVSTLGISRRPGAAVLVYFTTPTCAPCKTIQRPAIRRLQEQIGDRLQVIEIDASTHPEIASQWGVMSVPTTFVIDPHGQPRHVNHGVATADKLLQQIAISGQ